MRESLFVFALLFPFFLCAQQTNARAAQLREQLQHANSDSARARLDGLLAWEIKFENPDEAVALADQEIALATAEKNFLLMADGYRVKALTLVIVGKIVEGMTNYDSALVYARKAGSSYYQSSCYSLIAGMYGDHGDYDKAIEFYSKGLDIAQQASDPKMIAVLSNNLAESYQSDGRETELAQKYFALALEKNKSLKNWPAAGMNAANLAKEYLSSGQLEKAQTELQESIDLMNRDKTDAYQFGTTSHVLASIYFDLENMNEAEKYALVSIRIMDSLKRPANVLRPLTVLSNVYVSTKNIPQAEHYSNRLLQDALKQNAKLYIRDAYHYLSDIAQLKKNDAEALHYYELYKSWNDSVFEIGKEQSISNVQTRSLLAQKELEIKYESEKKDRENETLMERNDNLQKEKVGALMACMIFLFLGALLLLANRKKQKANAELETEKKIVEQQALEKGMLVHEIHHRVKNNLTMLKSLLYLQAKSSGQEDVKRILEECQARIQSMALVHQNLYEEHNNGKLDFVPFLESMFAELSISFRPQENDVAFEVNGTCSELNIAQAIPLGLIMNELVTNSLKYAFADETEGVIVVDIQEKEKKLMIQYADNGPGLKNEFNLQKGGFGFKLLHILSSQLNAAITYEKEESGAVFRIVLPV